MTKEERWLLEEKYGGQKSEAFLADQKRLTGGEPLGYVIGYVPFLDCVIHLDSKPLIPRPETEFWTEKAITEIQKTLQLTVRLGKFLRVLDLGAGSGAIGVAVAKAVPEARVTFAEVDPTHFPTIKKNLTTNLNQPFEQIKRVELVSGDLFENVSGIFDFILTNPPYIDRALDRVETSAKEHEPPAALYGGEHGLEIINRILKASSAYLADNGQLWLEHEPEQVEAIDSFSKTHNLKPKTYPDQYGVHRYTVLRKQME